MVSIPKHLSALVIEPVVDVRAVRAKIRRGPVVAAKMSFTQLMFYNGLNTFVDYATLASAVLRAVR